MLGKYIRAQLALAGLSFIFYTLCMLVLGFPYAIALGILGGALEFLPAVGWIASAAVILTIGFLTHAHWIWMAGLLVVSIDSGQVISRTGKYRFFPIAGTAFMTLGLYLLSLMGVGTPYALDALYMLVLGMGIGGVMQVLVIIVQNGVPHSELGVATSGATFFRSIGGSFGTAIFGAIFSNVLIGNLIRHLHGTTLPPGFSAADATPALLGHLPAVVHQGFVAGYAESIQTVFIVAVPIAALAFLASWLIPQVELKQWPDPAQGVPAADTAVAGASFAPEALEPQDVTAAES